MIQDSVLQQSIRSIVSAALLEDLGYPANDVSAQLIDAEEQARARIITRTNGIFCGIGWVEETARQVDPNLVIEWQVADGDTVVADQTLWEMHGRARSLLTAERTMLNFVQVLCGVATRTAEYVDLISTHATQLLDTRKTLPGLRLAQKYAVTCGGGANHRLGLYDAFLLKENHIAAAGGITAAVNAARELDAAKPVEVEVETLEQLREAMQAGAEIAMVDNFDLETTREAVAIAAGTIKLEASGGIDETTITDIAATGVDYISSGELTKNVQPMDLSMRFISNRI